MGIDDLKQTSLRPFFREMTGSESESTFVLSMYYYKLALQCQLIEHDHEFNTRFKIKRIQLFYLGIVLTTTYTQACQILRDQR